MAALCLAAPVLRVGRDGPGVRWGDRLLAAAAQLSSGFAVI